MKENILEKCFSPQSTPFVTPKGKKKDEKAAMKNT
jgi:hypothetical protein